MPQLEQLTDHQVVRVCRLQQSCQQAEDALSQGMDKLEQTLAQTLIIDTMGAVSYNAQMASAMEKLDSIENFVNGVIFYHFSLSSFVTIFGKRFIFGINLVSKSSFSFSSIKFKFVDPPSKRVQVTHSDRQI